MLSKIRETDTALFAMNPYIFLKHKIRVECIINVFKKYANNHSRYGTLRIMLGDAAEFP